MSDRKLLELAAKAAGHVLLNILDYEDGSSCYGVIAAGDGAIDFDPLNDDGDALRLAVTLNLQVTPGTYREDEATAYRAGMAEANERVNYQQDLAAATRRAIVRAAAELGKQGGDKP